MGKGERTREHIIAESAILFNQKGYAGASLADVMQATGLKKGGIYRHFESKEELAIAAFDHAVKLMAARFQASLVGKRTALARLEGIIGVYAAIPVDPPVPGGCPVMNAAIEADDGNPLLRRRARDAMNGISGVISTIIRDGMTSGEFRSDVVPHTMAGVIVATLEGAVMLSQLHDEPAFMVSATKFLQRSLAEQLLR